MITLELINAGLAPLVLYPAIVIAQLVVETTYEPAGQTGTADEDRPAYEGRYRYPIGPQFSRLHEDEGMELLSDPEHFRRAS